MNVSSAQLIIPNCKHWWNLKLLKQKEADSTVPTSRVTWRHNTVFLDFFPVCVTIGTIWILVGISAEVTDQVQLTTPWWGSESRNLYAYYAAHWQLKAHLRENNFKWSKTEAKSNHNTRGFTPKRVTSGGDHFRGLAPRQHSFEETLLQWRAYGDRVSNSSSFLKKIFILLSRESEEGAAHRTNPDSLRNCLSFRVFRLSLLPTSLLCCLLATTKQR